MHQKKKMTHRLYQQTTRHLAIVVAEYGVLCFLPKKTHLQPIFGSKHLGNTIKTLLNQSIAMKNIKNRSKTHTPPKTKKKLPKIKYDFLRVFQVKKHIIFNSSNHTEPFNTKNDRFGGQIPHQQIHSLFKPESSDLLSLLQPKKD
jgi:hypothetical protein